VFDIDGTICSDTKGNYKVATPIKDRINRINQLYTQGHQIIIYTARGMGSSGNDIEIAKNKWEFTTKAQLKEWGVKHHLLFMGKPSGDLYVDDKAVGDKIFFND
jgi:hypothetical protein